MNKISINLLPADLIIQEIEETKRSIKISVCIFIIATFIFVSLGILLLRFLQNQSAKAVNNSLNSSLEKVKTLKSQESSLAVLKNRVDLIGQLIKTESLEVSAYSTLILLVGSEADITGFTMDKKGKVTLSIESSDIRRLQSVLDKLSDPTKSSDRIGMVVVEGISRARNSTFKADVSFNFK